MSNKKNICLSLLAVLIVFHCANNLYFLGKHPLAEGKDSYAHITAFSNFKQIIENKQDNPFYRKEKSQIYNLVFGVIDYPPLFYASAYIVSLLCGSFFVNAALLTNTVYLIILLLSVYAIAARIDPLAGIISAFTCGMYPLIFLDSRYFNIELALAAMSALSIWLLTRTDGFRNRTAASFLGIVLGLGMLTKQTFFIYVGGPFIFYAMTCFLENQNKDIQKKQIIDLLISLSIAALISSIFYLNKGVYQSVFNRAGFTGAVENNDLLAHISYYFRSLPRVIGYIPVLLLMGSFFYVKKIEKRLRYLLILWGLVPICVLSCIKLKYAEYMIAFLPAFSLMTGLAIFHISKKKPRNLIVAAVVGIGILSYYNISLEKTKSFYSTYYPPLPKMTLTYSENKINTVEQVLESISQSAAKVGIFYDSEASEYAFPAYFVRATALKPRERAQIVDFAFCSEVFWQALDDFDIMIFITRSERQWITEISFKEFITRINRVSPNKLDVKQTDIIRLAEIRNDFKEIYALALDRPDNKPENVYIYKRIK